MRRDQVKIVNCDINNEIQLVQAENQRTFQARQEKQSELFDMEGFDHHWLLKESNLFSKDDPENYLNQIDFSTSDLSYEDDLMEEARKEKPRLIFIHGYGSSGMTHYKLCSILRHYFRLTTIDMLGLGASGRPSFMHVQTGRDCVEFFVGSLHAWLIKEGLAKAPQDESDEEQERFYLAGHSLGGFLSVHYALRMPDNIIKLFLFSPVGIPASP